MNKKNMEKFKCSDCERILSVAGPDAKIPECCQKPMEKMEELPPCELSATAEHARADEMMEPCDDGRTGKV